MELSKEEKKELIAIARSSILSGLGEEVKFPKNFPENSVFFSKSGAFVTLTINNKLRGCIGYTQSDEPLYKTVWNAAYGAAFQDPRFPPLTIEEYKEIEIEISILSKPFSLNSYDEIEIGKHGLILDEPGRRALLLPQVPIEHCMNKDQYLSALCRKAGLYEYYWKEKNINLKGFTANVFSDEGEDLR